MAGVYRARHRERTVLYRVLFHHFERFLTEYEGRFEREYGYFRPIVKEVVERYLDCGNPRCGFARIRSPDCAEERLVMFSCRTRGFCPSCHANRLEEWGEWMREMLLLDVPHRQVVFSNPKSLFQGRTWVLFLPKTDGRAIGVARAGGAEEQFFFVIDAYTHRRAEESLETGMLFRH